MNLPRHLSRSVATSALVLLGSLTTAADIPENFRRENLVAWCVAPPWDVVDRSPRERAALLAEFGLKRLAFNWRTDVDFNDELVACEEFGIEYFAFWNEHEDAFHLFAERGLQPQVWKTNPSPKVEGQDAKVAAAADRMRPFAQRVHDFGLPFGLYNHGSWGGRPENLIAVCEQLRSEGLDNVGIVYNFHHAHPELAQFAEGLAQMMPYLLCLNLNGMADPDTVDHKTHANKILPIGTGLHEAAMIRIVIEAGYEGPIGIIGHQREQDVAEVLRQNLAGLDAILAEL